MTLNKYFFLNYLFCYKKKKKKKEKRKRIVVGKVEVGVREPHAPTSQ